MFERHPTELLLLVDEDAHELGAAHGRVRVVGVDGNKLAADPSSRRAPSQRCRVGCRCRPRQTGTLLQAQQTAVLAGVVGVEDGTDGLGLGALGVGRA